MTRRLRYLLFGILIIFLLQSIAQPAMADEKIVMDLFYSSSCDSCDRAVELVTNEYINNEDYINILNISLKDVATNSDYSREMNQDYPGLSIPFLILKTESEVIKLKRHNITTTDIDNAINGLKPVIDENKIVIDSIFGRIVIDISTLSLPILTIILGGLDSLNPCAFFILIFLLNLLVYAKSRKRMLLIGGIFIFFSGLLYYIFMFVLFNTVFIATADNTLIVSIIAGIIALTLGIFNIKDFFFFKKGASLSIPDEKKPGIFRQMRHLVKEPRLTAVILGTIILAGTVNFYELLCTLGLPLVFTRQLVAYELPTIQYYLYILFYNIVYVIPLIIIVLIFVSTLGKWKLTEWHGQLLKLVTGVMLTSFGALFIIDYKLLENIVTPILLLGFSLLTTGVIAFIWKKYQEKKSVESIEDIVDEKIEK